MTRRVRHAMPDDVRRALDDEGLVDRYHGRPEHQQNDYLGWIDGAKMAEPRQKRLDQMLDEPRKGGVCMKMVHRPSEHN